MSSCVSRTHLFRPSPSRTTVKKILWVLFIWLCQERLNQVGVWTRSVLNTDLINQVQTLSSRLSYVIRIVTYSFSNLGSVAVLIHNIWWPLHVNSTQRRSRPSAGSAEDKLPPSVDTGNSTSKRNFGGLVPFQGQDCSLICTSIFDPLSVVKKGSEPSKYRVLSFSKQRLETLVSC